MAAVKAGVAALGAGLLLWGWWLRRSGSPQRHRHQRDVALGLLGAFGFLCWGNLLQFRPGFVHGPDAFHYYVGAKYFSELGYGHLYRCALVADAQDGLGDLARARPVRDLATDQVVAGRTMLGDPAECVDRFSPERWAQFTHDIRWFREHMVPDRWERVFRNYGYNATPVWGVVGTALTNTGPASWAQILLLALLDPALLLVMWGAVWWAFGWRAMCVAAIYWGTNYPARFAWTGGSILRQDWLALSIVGLCLLRRGWPGAAGISLTWAAGLRVFPVWLLGGLALKALARMLTDRSVRLARDSWRVALGVALALAVLGPLSTLVGSGREAWVGFWRNSVKHVATPVTNRMGLATLAAYDHEHRARRLDETPGMSWEDARRRAFERRRPLFIASAIGAVALVAWAARTQPDWTAALLGVGLIAGTGEVTCYYYSAYLAFGLLGDRREGIGAGLCALSAAGGMIALVLQQEDERYVLLSAATLLFVVAATIALGRHPIAETG